MQEIIDLIGALVALVVAVVFYGGLIVGAGYLIGLGLKIAGVGL